MRARSGLSDFLRGRETRQSNSLFLPSVDDREYGASDKEKRPYRTITRTKENKDKT